MRTLLPAAALLMSLSGLMLLSGCTGMARQLDREGSLVDSRATDWRSVATDADRIRLREWRSSFVDALKASRAAGNGAKIDAEGVLLRPDAALPNPAIPAGTYACRTIKIGAKQPGLMDYLAYPEFSCRVSDGLGSDGPVSDRRDVQQLVKLTGSQRPVGLVYPGDPLRSVFLGTLMLGDESRTMQYGGDRERDMAGYVERVGPQRWRLILPRPAFESKLDVIELVPAG